MRNKIIVSLLCLLLLTGCWDSKEIEDIGIVVGIGVDSAEEEEQIKMLNQYVVPGQIPTSQGGTPTGKPYQNITMTGTTLFQILRNNSFESNRPPNYTHLKSILMSSGLLEQVRADEVVDLFLRDHEFRRTTPVFITRKKVEEVFSIEPTKELFPAIQIKSISENAFKNNYIPKNLRIGDISKFFSENKSFLLPGITIDNGRLRSDGAGIISNESFHCVGWIKKEEMAGVRYVLNDVTGGYINFTKDEISNGPATLEIKGATTTYEPKVKNETLTMKLNIEVSTTLAEDWSNSRNVFRKGWKNEVEQAAKDQIIQEVESIIDKAQQEYEIDFLHLSEWVKIHEPKYWQKNENRWNEIFPEMDITVDVKVNILHFGTQNLK